MTSDDSITEEDCCGNGCTNCILDAKLPTATKAGDPDSSAENCLQKYRKYELIESSFLLPYIQAFKFRLKDAASEQKLKLHIPPGHHVMLRTPPAAEGRFLTRPYSPFHSAPEHFEFQILVNLKPNGRMTKYIKSLKIGDSVEFRGPVGRFVHQPCRALAVFTQGVAVAPTVPIIEQVLHNEDDFTRVSFTACFQDVENIIFRDKIHEYNKFWNFSGRIFLSREDEEDCKRKLRYKEAVFARRLDEGGVQEVFDGVDDCFVVVCGSKRFEEFVVRAVEAVGVGKERISVL